MIDKFQDFISYCVPQRSDVFYRRTCIGIHSGIDLVCDRPGMEEGDEVVGRVVVGGAVKIGRELYSRN